MIHTNLLLSVLLLAVATDDAPDIRSVAADLEVPIVELVPAAAGKRVKEFLPDFANTGVYHVTYLPVDWQPGGSYPVIVEYTGNGKYVNQFGDKFTGRVEDGKLGYGISAGRGFVWICLPCINDEGTDNVIAWWGDPPQHKPRTTVEYCKKVVPWICAKYGGDPKKVVLTGFSRGAIACNFIGLHDDEIAKLWCAFIPFSHYDGVVNWGYPGSDRTPALARLERLSGRPQLICAEETRGNHSVDATKTYLDAMGVKGNFTFLATGFRNHNDQWILRPSKARVELRSWVVDVLK